jgi:hypothetical protein
MNNLLTVHELGLSDFMHLREHEILTYEDFCLMHEKQEEIRKECKMEPCYQCKDIARRFNLNPSSHR